VGSRQVSVLSYGSWVSFHNQVDSKKVRECATMPVETALIARWMQLHPSSSWSIYKLLALLSNCCCALAVSGQGSHGSMLRRRHKFVSVRLPSFAIPVVCYRLVVLLMGITETLLAPCFPKFRQCRGVRERNERSSHGRGNQGIMACFGWETLRVLSSLQLHRPLCSCIHELIPTASPTVLLYPRVLIGIAHASNHPADCIMQEGGWKRSDLVLSTKIFWGGSGVNDKGLSRKHIIEGAKASLKRLDQE
jgi:hypothetical protein